MTETTFRAVPLGEGRRTGLRLDDPTWTTIEWLAERKGETWQSWCARAVKAVPEGENVAATLRATATTDLLMSTVLEGRAEQLKSMNAHPLMRESGMLNDKQLAESLKNAVIGGESDFVSFTVLYGIDGAGQPCVWIKNMLRGALHFAFLPPAGSLI